MTVEQLQTRINDLDYEITVRPTWPDLETRLNNHPQTVDNTVQIRCLWTALGEVADKFQCLLRYLEENYGLTVDVQDLL